MAPNKKCNHYCNSNINDVYKTFIGCKLVGFLQNYDDEHVNDYLIFECGWALVLRSNGSHWTEKPEDVKLMITKKQNKLGVIKKELEEVLALANSDIFE